MSDEVEQPEKIDKFTIDLRSMLAQERIAEVLEQFYKMKYSIDLVHREAARGQVPPKPKADITYTAKW